jgi:hypothetical protein
VLEHIPGAGDTLAFGEIVRVVRPGGIIVVTVPYAASYHETFVAGPVYEREYGGEPVFFERHYDSETLRSRLIGNSSTQLLNLELWGERLPGERLLGWSRHLRMALSPLEPLLAITSLRCVTKAQHAKAAFVSLKKM